MHPQVRIIATHFTKTCSTHREKNKEYTLRALYMEKKRKFMHYGWGSGAPVLWVLWSLAGRYTWVTQIPHLGDWCVPPRTTNIHFWAFFLHGCWKIGKPCISLCLPHAALVDARLEFHIVPPEIYGPCLERWQGIPWKISRFDLAWTRAPLFVMHGHCCDWFVHYKQTASASAAAELCGTMQLLCSFYFSAGCIILRFFI